MRRPPRGSTFIFIACVVLIGFVPCIAAGSSLCIKTSDGTHIVLKNFVLKKGKPFAVAGWTVWQDKGDVLFRPLSGQAVARSDGSGAVLGLTEYQAGIFQGSPPASFQAGAVRNYSIVLSAQPGGVVGPGASASALLVVMTSGGNHDEAPDNALTVTDCSDVRPLGLP